MGIAIATQALRMESDSPQRMAWLQRLFGPRAPVFWDRLRQNGRNCYGMMPKPPEWRRNLWRRVARTFGFGPIRVSVRYRQLG